MSLASLRRLWAGFAESYDPDDAAAHTAPRFSMLTFAAMAAVFLAVGYLPGLAEGAEFRWPWLSVLLTGCGSSLSLVAYRHDHRGFWGTLGMLLDSSFFVAALVWAATSSSAVVGGVFAAVLALTLFFFHGASYALSLLVSFAITVPALAIVLAVQPDPWIATGVLAGCVLGLARMRATTWQRAKRPLGVPSVTAASGARYRLGSLVGAGGMGVVYRGIDAKGRLVAIKRLHPYWLDTPAQHKRFLREALIAGELDHPGVVPLLDHGEAPGAGPFLVMPLLTGSTLRAHVEHHGGRLPWVQVAEITKKVLDVLAAAHAKQIVHCDVKPSNIFLCDDGSVKLLDFGIAKPPAALVDTTLSVHIVGTPACMAPEQLLDPGAIDERTDLWGLGATMFWSGSGEWPRALREPLGSLDDAARQPARPIQTVAEGTPPALARVIDQALAARPDDRWSTAREMLHELAEAPLHAAIPGSDRVASSRAAAAPAPHVDGVG